MKFKVGDILRTHIMPEGESPTYRVVGFNTIDNRYILGYIDSRYGKFGEITEFSQGDCELFYNAELKDKRNFILENLLG
jgi:hypothetical protein